MLLKVRWIVILNSSTFPYTPSCPFSIEQKGTSSLHIIRFPDVYCIVLVTVFASAGLREGAGAVHKGGPDKQQTTEGCSPQSKASSTCTGMMQDTTRKTSETSELCSHA